ncbi:MAG: (2Fe-2S) ferredoxin domain-containing protein [Planctomycetes bacterium]|nr:(2Fe-2S) ferredoxin domain-containing protein [Planctomycetota bacterium]
MAKFEKHIFVCENQRPQGHPRGCCADRGGAEIRALIKEGIANRGLNKVVRANEAGCLDQCEFGTTLVVYPDNVWYGNVQPDDVDEILDHHILNGEIVTRLVIPEEKLTGRTRDGQA